MRGDIIKSVRLNPHAQLAADSLMNENKKISFNKLIHTLLIDASRPPTKEEIDAEAYKLQFEARGRRIKHLEDAVARIGSRIWRQLDENARAAYEHDVNVYIYENWGVIL